MQKELEGVKQEWTSCKEQLKQKQQKLNSQTAVLTATEQQHLAQVADLKENHQS